MEVYNKLFFGPKSIFHFIICLLLFITINPGERRLTDDENLNEITLKMKGPIKNYGFLEQNSDGYCFKGEYPSKIILNEYEYEYNNINITELDLMSILLI